MDRKPQLPIDSYISDILLQLGNHNCVIVSAEPGAGKTTRLPPALLGLNSKAVWVLEPRRIAAIAASSRIAEENNWELGREVGYQVRFENRSSQNTRLLFLTEALLLRKILRDPELKNIGCVVLDEFHERSLHVDLALGALKELQELARPDLKIVVMSATLDAKPLSQYLGDAPIVEVPGKVYPLQIFNDTSPQTIRTGHEFTERMQKLIRKALIENPLGDLLCFLPGRGEIERLRDTLSASFSNFAVLPLHGQLNLAEQRAALQQLPNKRKIILATNVAESSLTVEGVSIVVDCGLARIAEVHPRTGYESIEIARISKASAKQRAGRAARNSAGSVYRAWMEFDELSMKDFDTAEVHRSDLSEGLLMLAALGVTRPESFSWFEIPRTIEQAKLFLRFLGALEKNGALTKLGNQLIDFPLHPRLAKLLLEGESLGLNSLACELAALLSEPTTKSAKSITGSENDLWQRWEDWQASPNHPKYKSLTRSADQLFGLLRSETKRDEQKLSELELEAKSIKLLLSVYPDRLCRRRRVNEPQAKMVGGRGVCLHPDSNVRQSDFFLALELKEGRDASEAIVFQAVGVPEALIKEKFSALATQNVKLEWDDEKERFIAIESLEWNGIALSKEHRRPASALEIESDLFEVAKNRFDRILSKNGDLAAWFARIRFLHKSKKFPLLTDQQFHAGLELACFGETSLTSIYGKNLIPYFESQFEAPLREALAKDCPEYWIVPSGSKIRIIYSEEQGPQVEVRLQELFGLKAAPVIGGQFLTLVLLAPNYRPVQVTRDLNSFWTSGYLEVRKELRLRYPKHSWPEDPLLAAPQAKGRPRNMDAR